MHIHLFHLRPALSPVLQHGGGAQQTAVRHKHQHLLSAAAEELIQWLQHRQTEESSSSCTRGDGGDMNRRSDYSASSFNCKLADVSGGRRSDPG